MAEQIWYLWPWVETMKELAEGHAIQPTKALALWLTLRPDYPDPGMARGIMTSMILCFLSEDWVMKEVYLRYAVKLFQSVSSTHPRGLYRELRRMLEWFRVGNPYHVPREMEFGRWLRSIRRVNIEARPSGDDRVVEAWLRNPVRLQVALENDIGDLARSISTNHFLDSLLQQIHMNGLRRVKSAPTPSTSDPQRESLKKIEQGIFWAHSGVKIATDGVALAIEGVEELKAQMTAGQSFQLGGKGSKKMNGDKMDMGKKKQKADKTEAKLLKRANKCIQQINQASTNKTLPSKSKPKPGYAIHKKPSILWRGTF